MSRAEPTIEKNVLLDYINNTQKENDLEKQFIGGERRIEEKQNENQDEENAEPKLNQNGFLAFFLPPS